jgi:hypothetical protein
LDWVKGELKNLSAFLNGGLSERDELEGIINNISDFFGFDVINQFLS